MARKKDAVDEISNVIAPIIFFYFLYLLLLWFTNRQEFWKWLLIGLGVIVIIIFILFSIIKAKNKRKKKLIDSISTLGLDKDINNFINIAGKEKSRWSWKYMDYGFNLDKMRIFIKTLTERGLEIKDTDDLKLILKRFIDNKEEALIKGGFELKNHDFSLLNGTDFEKLLIRLYGAMGYLVEHLGGNGDQGADLILTKDGQRILIQAKCYKNWGVGNSSVQQAIAAKTHYGCSEARVVGIPYFTKEAQELAKSNGVLLVDKKELQSLLLENLKESWN